MAESQKLQEVHKAYKMCRQAFLPSTEIMDVAAEIHDEEEYEFYKLVHEFFLQKKQRELIEKGVC